MRTSVSLNNELASYVDEVTSSAGDNNAEAIRDALRHGREQAERADSLESEAERLRERIEELEEERDRLKTEKRRVLEQHEETTELLQYVEQERAAEQQWREAGLLTRAKWRVVGMPTPESNT
ncbi:hypothetical protein EGH24_11060 [Halonotius terrestris]|uniref:Uncharacterized protein n=1 Tax=Halonotius terrestris TaxID=2487750 RepID=A0A8J8PB59_9EURY|nr:hypothetical protein [Halonotius terrestris]TQQ80005.1 hypothetical protein EGH24_11060 [Halonotius terrestris]